MSFRTPLDCSLNSTEGLGKLVSDDLSTAFNDITNQITAAEELAASIGIDKLLDNLTNTLQDIVSLGDPYSSVKDINTLPDLFGIDTPNTQEDDEKRVFDSTDLVLSNGLFLKKAPTDSAYVNNIEILRRIYFAVGRDLELANNEYLNKTDNAYRYSLEVKKAKPLIPNKPLTIDKIRKIFNDNSIAKNDYITMYDYSVLLVKRIPLLASNINVSELSVRYGTTAETSTSSIIHKTTPKNTTTAINRWVDLGYTTELPDILDGIDPALDFNIIDPIFNALQAKNSRLINDINFYLSRLDTVNSSDVSTSIGRTINEMDILSKNLDSIFQFEVSEIQEFDTLTKLRDKLTDEEIHYLLVTQKYVKSVDLTISESDLMTVIQQATSESAGESSTSTSVMNKSSDLKSINYSTLLYILSDVQDIKDYLKLGINKENLTKMLDTALILGGRKFTTTEAPQQTLSGFPSYTSASAIVNQRMNLEKNFKLTLSFGALDKVLAEISAMYDKYVGKTISALFKIITNLVQKAIRMVNQLRDRLLATIMPLKRKLDAFISKYLTLIGKGDFGSSVLKCAVNFNLGLNTDIFAYLQNLIDQLIGILNNLIAILVGLLVKAIEKIICPVITMVDQLIGQANSYLPSFCSFNSPLLLPADAVKALNDLRRIASMQSKLVGSYSGDLIRAKAVVTTANDRLSKFIDQAGCLNKTASTMMSSTLINASKSVALPPLGL